MSRAQGSALFSRVDAASLGVFRIAFGVILLIEMIRYVLPDAGGVDWVAGSWLRPRILFPYDGFGWLRPLPEAGMYALVYGLMLCAACIALGAWYRVVMPCFALGFAYLFLLDRAHYLNHFYLITLLGFLLCVVPAHAAYSVDAARRPRLRVHGAPLWALWLLRVQIGLVYFWGGFAKLEPEWLSGVPARLALMPSLDKPLIGMLAGEPWFQLFIAYGGLLFDLLVFPLLVWTRTRPYAYAAAVLFHLTNAVLFSIGIFPWLMIAATTIAFAPSWPRRWWGTTPHTLRAAPGAVLLDPPPPIHRRAVLAALGLYLVVQLLAPLRPHLAEGPTGWTEQGHRFSWRMMLRAKFAEPRFVQVLLKDPGTGRSWLEDPARHLDADEVARLRTDSQVQRRLQERVHASYSERGHARLQMQVVAWPLEIRVTRPDGTRTVVPPQHYLTVWQAHKAAVTPEFLVQFAHELRRQLAAQPPGTTARAPGATDARAAQDEVRAWQEAAVTIESWVSLNGRRPQRLVPADLDLTRVDRSAPIASWIAPLEQPLPDLRDPLYTSADPGELPE